MKKIGILTFILLCAITYVATQTISTKPQSQASTYEQGSVKVIKTLFKS